jgi:hypothetical protein
MSDGDATTGRERQVLRLVTSAPHDMRLVPLLSLGLFALAWVPAAGDEDEDDIEVEGAPKKPFAPLQITKGEHLATVSNPLSSAPCRQQSSHRASVTPRLRCGWVVQLTGGGVAAARRPAMRTGSRGRCSSPTTPPNRKARAPSARSCGAPVSLPHCARTVHAARGSWHPRASFRPKRGADIRALQPWRAYLPSWARSRATC